MKKMTISDAGQGNTFLEKLYFLHDAFIRHFDITYLPNHERPDDTCSIRIEFATMAGLGGADGFEELPISATFHQVEDLLLDWREFHRSGWSLDEVRFRPVFRQTEDQQLEKTSRVELHMVWNLLDANNTWIKLGRSLFSFEASNWEFDARTVAFFKLEE